MADALSTTPLWYMAVTTKPRKPNSHTVYVIDDDQAVRDSVRMLIESDGLSASTFASAEAFLDNFPPGPRGCLVLDVHMPGMNGVELLEHLHAWGIFVPVIIVTAYKEEHLIKRALQAGAYAVVMKPFNDNELLHLIEQAMAGHGPDNPVPPPH
jgi:two-component system response regulator FixJ